MATIFTKIISGEIPSYKIAENEHFYAFLDISPLQKGHTLVVPKREEDYIFNLTDDELSGMVLFARRVAKAIEKSVDCKAWVNPSVQGGVPSAACARAPD